MTNKIDQNHDDDYNSFRNEVLSTDLFSLNLEELGGFEIWNNFIGHL